MSQFMIIRELLAEKVGAENVKKHIVCTTDAESGNLIKIAKKEGYKTFIVPSGVGGRFSELCPVGLLPAAFTGIDIKALLAGAAFADGYCSEPDCKKNPAYMFAALNFMAMRRGKPITVMMPYADSLKFIADWFAQLWAESLGKKFDNQQHIVNVGPTPVKALGATDQHSQVQLYVEGPFDKIVTFIAVETFRKVITIPKIYENIPSLGFLGGVTHNKLLDVERVSTEYALLTAGKLNMTLTLPEVNEHTVGQLLYLFEVATAFAGELMNINAFDQPGVEAGKNATYAIFGRPGYEETKRELDKMPQKNTDYIC
jgi:glucose-6-phosphate isomerase